MTIEAGYRWPCGCVVRDKQHTSPFYLCPRHAMDSAVSNVRYAYRVWTPWHDHFDNLVSPYADIIEHALACMEVRMRREGRI